MRTNRSRRNFLSDTLKVTSVVSLGPSILQMGSLARAGSLSNIGPLGDPDANGIRLPTGFQSRVVAVSGERVSGYRWHKSPDGGATFPTAGGGWVYVSNSEESVLTGAGASAVEFDALGDIVAARRILGGTNGNCAGGPTPWNTWLSCEEIDRGAVWECDPFGNDVAVERPALGWFKHEAAAVDPVFGHIYLTEDEGDGCFYRFTPAGSFPSLEAGTLEVAIVSPAGAVSWDRVSNPNPGAFGRRTRNQVPGATRFDGGEGCWYQDGLVWFTTKGDNRVWVYDATLQQLDILYDRATNPNPILSGVDNVTVSASGDVLVAEDGGDMQLCVIDETGVPQPLLQIVGQDSEITGPAFSPDGTRLYLSSQRGFDAPRRRGITYEITGPF